jgi:predicted RNase H-like HicB family nuclease
MFDFTKQIQQYEELAERIKEVNEFWINAMVNTTKELFNATKTK